MIVRVSRDSRCFVVHEGLKKGFEMWSGKFVVYMVGEVEVCDECKMAKVRGMKHCCNEEYVCWCNEERCLR